MADAKKIDSSSVPVKELLKRFEEAKNARKNYEADWDENYDYYQGNQWAGVDKVAWFQSEPVYNKIFEFVEIHRAYLSDNRWGVDVVPASLPKGLYNIARDANPMAQTQQAVGIEEDIIAMVDKVNKLLDFLWLQNRMQSKLAEVILYTFLYGTGLLKCSFDANDVGDSGIGQIETKVISPWYVFPDPNATSVHDASFIIEHHPVTYRWILERYPEMADEVKSNGLGSTSEYYERRGTRGRGSANNEEAKFVDVYECWYNDSSVVEDSEGDTPKLAYPSGRMTLMTSTGVVLEDKPNPYSMFPYIRFVEIPRPGEFFGDCTVSRVKDIQQNINTILRTIIDNGLWLVHGIWVVDTTSGLDPNALAGFAPRDVIAKNPGTEARRDVGEALPQHVFQLLEHEVDAFDKVAGTPDVLKGIVPGRQPVATTQLQQEAGEIRTRERQRRIEEGLEDLGSLWLDIASEYWNDKRIIRNKRMLGGFEMFEMNKADLQEWKFDIHVVPGSTSPSNNAQQLEKAFQLMERAGVQIPPDYLVELAQLPGLQAAMGEPLPQQVDNGQVDAGGAQPMDAQPLPQDQAQPTDMGAPQPPLQDAGQPPLM